MRAAIACFVVGIGAGAGGAGLVVPHPHPAAADGEQVSRPASEAPEAGLRPAPSAVASAEAAAMPPAGNAVFALDLADWATLDGVKDQKDENIKHVWRTIGRAYAHAGRTADLLRLAAAEIAGDATNSIGILWLFGELPEEARLSALETLLVAHPEIQNEKGHVGRVYLLCGATEKGFQLLLEAARESKGEDWDVLFALSAVDPGRADGELWKAQAEGKWSLAVVARVANAFQQHARADLAKRWSELATSMSGPAPAPIDGAAAAASAVREAEDATRESPADADAWTTLAQARQQAGDKKGAFEAYARALEVGGLDVAVLESMYAVDSAAALAPIERAAREDGGSDVVMLLVRAYMAAERGRDAGEAFFGMNRQGDDSSEWLDHGIAALAPEAALRDIERRLRRRAARDDGSLLQAYGDALLASGQAERAFVQYGRAADANSSDVAYEGLVRSDPARAVPLLERLRREAPGNEALDLALAWAYGREGRKEDAFAVLEAYVPDAPAVFRVRAVIDPETTLPRLRALCEAEGASGDAWVALGDACRDLGRAKEAGDAYRRAMAAGRDDVSVLVRLASVR